MAERDHFFRLLARSAEAMEDSAQPPAIFAQNRQGIVPRVALMDHHVQLQLHGEIELLLKQTRLLAFQRAVVEATFDFLLRLRLERLRYDLHLAFARDRRAWQIMVIQSRLADRRDARTLRQLTKRRDDVVARFLGIVRVHPDHREDIVDISPPARPRAGCSRSKCRW